MKKQNKLSVEQDIEQKIKTGELRPVHIPRFNSSTDILKYQLCSEIIKYKKVKNLTQQAVADIVQINKSEMSKIFSYNLDSFSTDRLLAMVETLIKSGADIQLEDLFNEVKNKMILLDKKLKTLRKVKMKQA